ncbi:hypothetical protein K437DRAFT_245235 [Tilletiaria anomala UBC 951]|uniref:C2H2-type domain-containing protein n=1 Tax=Tilletiaria anomala (strain ATCC 24038 / CBS 436.72 / UBC 951) TaxID=1037660 RepID=A0A066W5D6_TILAU|nr:uncharacterized protein K437DRAFT_245235 [Tilletiaria anomala UBC 951]KDN49187.1 hypothetical protein K437DRAFT_245235 [Tilletiaria anomala UBC 951]
MSGKQTASGGAGVGPSRRSWDVEEFTAKARERDREEKERAVENEERMRKGLKPNKRKKEEMPKPTKMLEARVEPLALDKNQGKSMMVEGKKGPGFYCELCNRICKDSGRYLDHINGRMHLRMMGMTTQVVRSSLEAVRAKIAALRESRANGSQARSYDFEARLRQIAEEKQKEKEERKAKKKAAKEDARRKGAADVAMDMDQDAMAMLGFGGFGSTKKR